MFFSDDMQDEREIDGLQIVNPFRSMSGGFTRKKIGGHSQCLRTPPPTFY